MSFKLDAGTTKSIVIIMVVVVVIGVGMYFISKTFGGLTNLFNKVTTGAGNVVDTVLGTPSQSADNATATGVAIYNDSQLPTSPWNPQFYKNAPNGASLMTSTAGDALAEQIWDTVSWWQISTPDPSPVIGAINQCSTQSQVSFLADRFQQSYNKDLFTWIYTIWWKYGAHSADNTTSETVIQTMDQFVNSLPQYNA